MKSVIALSAMTLALSTSAFADCHSGHGSTSLINDHSTTVANCGVGNYLFRNEPTCANTTAPVAAKDEVVSAQSSAVAPATELKTSIYFENASSDLSHASKMKLESLAKSAKEKGFAAVEIEAIGFADATGTDAINAKLSKERASAAAKILSKEIKSAQLSSEGRGALTSEGANWKNRRVDIVIRAAE
jgi:outer membrane protein OmpA-like peptidoglycan-associated protein